VTDDNHEAPAEAVVEVQTPPARGRRRLTGRLDPGWATLVAASLALTGTIVTVAFRSSDGGDSATEKAVVSTTGAERVANSSGPTTAPTTSSTSTTSTTSSTVEPSTSAQTTTSPPVAPIVQVVSALNPDQRKSVDAASNAILALADQLPLIVNDQFANNDYAWPVRDRTYDGGIQCTWAVADGAYSTLIHTADGAAWCSDGLSKVAKDFVLTVEEQLRDASNTDIGLLFRVADDQSYYALDYSPQTQTLSLSFFSPDGEQPIIPPTYVEQIKRAESNKVVVMALGSSMALYVNDSLVAMISNETRLLTAGRILVRIQLNEPNEDEMLSLTHFELRGS
jgi:hypothetical protein